MRTTFDSNLWEHVVHPMVFPLPPDRHRRLLAVNDAVKDGRVTGFICQSVATMEGVKRKDRPEFLSQQPVRARVVETDDPTMSMMISAPDQSNRPELMPVLIDRMKDAVQLGMRLIEIPPYTELELPAAFYADRPSDFVEKFGRVAHAIMQRNVGRAPLEALGFELAQREGGKSYIYARGALPNVAEFTKDERRRIEEAVAEASDGDAVAAHVASGNDLFCSEDYNCTHSGTPSVLDPKNRQWLSDEFSIRFVNLTKLAEMLTT